MASKVVGVDIGAAAVRAVEVSGYDGNRPSITKYHEVPLPESAVRRGEVIEAGTVATALRRLWSVGGFKEKNVVLGVGGHRVFARDVTVPKQPLDRIRESLPYHVQDLLPVPVADVLMDFYPVQESVGEQGPEISGLLVAGLKETINANVNAAMAAGLRPIHVDLIPFALSRAVAPIRGSRGRDVIIAIGANTTNVVIVDDGVPLFVRTIPNGGDDVTRAIAGKLQWAPERAEQAKRALGMSTTAVSADDRPVVEIIYEAVGDLLSGVRNTISYYATSRPSEPVQRILLTGGGAQLNGISHALAELTRLPVAYVEPLGSIALPGGRGARPGREALDSYVTAFGLALGSHA